MVPKSDHLANPRFDKKPSAQVGALRAEGFRRAGIPGVLDKILELSGAEVPFNLGLDQRTSINVPIWMVSVGVLRW